MKSIIIAILVASLTSFLTVSYLSVGQSVSENINNLSVTEELTLDVWLGRVSGVGGSERPGPAIDSKILADSSNSVCFISRIEVDRMDGPEDLVSCRVTKDEFTNWWQVEAVQGDGTNAGIACNARCLVWE